MESRVPAGGMRSSPCSTHLVSGHQKAEVVHPRQDGSPWPCFGQFGFTCRNKSQGRRTSPVGLEGGLGSPVGVFEVKANTGLHYQVTPNPELHTDILSSWASRELGVLQGWPRLPEETGRRSSHPSATRVSTAHVLGWLALYLALERKLASAFTAMEDLNYLRCCFC